MQVQDQICLNEDAIRVSYENKFKGLTEFLLEDSKLEKCDDKSTKELDSRMNPFQERKSDSR